MVSAYTLLASLICLGGSGSGPSADATSTFDGMLVACEQSRHGYVILDPEMDWADPAAVKWEWSADEAPEIPRVHRTLFQNPSDAKPVLGGTHLLACASGGGLALIRVNNTHVVWYAKAGGNTHSAELLPDSNIVTASSTGGYLALFDRSEPLKDPRKPDLTKAFFPDAHGVVWDAKRSRLWAIGGAELKRYRYANDADSPALAEEQTYRLPEPGGHDLFPVAGKDRLYLTAHDAVWTFDPASETFAEFARLPSVKSISARSADGPTIVMQATQSWWSDSIRYVGENNLKTLPGARFYKVRWWVPNRFSYRAGH